MPKLEDAQRNLTNALEAAGADFKGALERGSEGHAVTFSKPSRRISRSGIDGTVLEDDVSAGLLALVEEIRREMNRG